MTSSQHKKPLQSVRDFKESLKQRIATFISNPYALAELGFLRTVRRPKWDVDLDYYGNRKHHTEYRAMREAKERGEKVPQWNSSGADCVSYPMQTRILIDRQSGSAHRMHAQLRRSIVAVLSYLIDKCDLVSGVCVSIRKNHCREIYVKEIAAATGLGKRTVQRSLSNLARHSLINRGVALIGITPQLYKSLGVFSAVRAMVKSLKTLMQFSNYRGTRVNAETMVPHKNFHRFNKDSSKRPSLRRLLASTAIAVEPSSASRSKPSKVPRWNSGQSQSPPPPSTAPPSSEPEPSQQWNRTEAGAKALSNLKASLQK